MTRRIDDHGGLDQPFATIPTAEWIGCGGNPAPPVVLVFRRQFELQQPAVIRCHVSADERYELFLDGERIGRGPDRGDARNWFFDTCDLHLSRGPHTLVAKVWALGEYAPLAQLSVAPGVFLFAPEDEAHVPLLGTGCSEWTVRELEGFSFKAIPYAFGIGWRESIDGTLCDEEEVRTGSGAGWMAAVARAPARAEQDSAEGERNLEPSMLKPAVNRLIDLPAPAEISDLPAGTFETAASIPLCTGSSAKAPDSGPCGPPLHIPAQTVRRYVFILDNYYCAYPEIRLSGGRKARLRIGFSESACTESHPPEHEHYRYEKGSRDRVDGKYLICSIGSTFVCPGGTNARFSPLWWFSGRCIELLVETGDEPLCIEEFVLHETRYPLEMESRFCTKDPALSRVLELCFRTLQMCSHETYMDCPFYEQLMYVGDSRLEALTTYAVSRDDALPRKAIRMFNASRQPNGLTQACYPYRGRHTIAPFALWWISMVHDYAMWRNPSVLSPDVFDHMRAIIDYFAERENRDGLVIPGTRRQRGDFNFIDWVEYWQNGYGVPPGDGELNSVFNWQRVCVLKQYAELEDAFGNPHRAQEARGQIDRAVSALTELFWSQEKGLFADDPQQRFFSEHAQCLAVLSETLPKDRLIAVEDGLAQTDFSARSTLYFSHYYFETCAKLNRMDLFECRLEDWRALPPRGFVTVPETPEPTRSDCHAWGAHPLYHFFATVLGIRPASFGFQSVEIQPRLGSLPEAFGRMVHPDGGVIEVEMARQGRMVSGEVTLPPGLSGQLVLPDSTQPLSPGTMRFETEFSPTAGVKGRFE